MRPGAELRIGTDIGDYARTILLALRGQAGFDWHAARPRRLAPAARRLAADPL